MAKKVATIVSLKAWIEDKWFNRVRQFGLRTAVVQAARVALRPVYEARRDLVMTIPDHHPIPVQYPEIHDMTRKDVNDAVARGDLTDRQGELLLGFLREGCRGFLADIDGHLAGYGFVQPTGTYVFGGGGRLRIPADTMILKNLLVFPEFRGQSLGKKLNQARIASIPDGQIPIVFVMTENRFAIRNLKMFGFEECLIVTRTTWFKKWTRQSSTILLDSDISRALIAGLTPS